MIIDLHTHTGFGSMRPYLPPQDLVGGFNRLGCSRSFRAHKPVLEEFLEDWYDRSAETCNLFENISEVDKYCVTCTVCRHFEGRCVESDLKGPSILSLLKASYKHDGLVW